MLYTLMVFKVFNSRYSTGIIAIQCYSPQNRLLNFNIKTLQLLSLFNSFSQYYIFSFQGKECYYAGPLSLLTYSSISYYSGMALGRLSGLRAPSKVAIAIYYRQATQRVIQYVAQGLLVPYSRVANSEVSSAFQVLKQSYSGREVQFTRGLHIGSQPLTAKGYIRSSYLHQVVSSAYNY